MVVWGFADMSISQSGESLYAQQACLILVWMPGFLRAPF